VTQVWLALTASLTLLGLVGWLRRRETAAWRASLMRYRLGLPRDLSAPAVTTWLGQLAALTQPPRWSLLPPAAVGLEIEATASGITHTLLVPKVHRSAVLASLRAALPGVRVDELTDHATTPPFTAAAELRLVPSWQTLADDRVSAAATGVLAVLQPLPTGAVVRLQWLMAGSRISGYVPSGSLLGRLSGRLPDEAAQARVLKRKQRTPLLMATGRIAASAPTAGAAHGAVQRVIGAVRVLESAEARLVRRWLPASLVARRIANPTLPWAEWPVIVNAAEAVGLVALPLDGPALPGLRLDTARVVPPAPDMAHRGLVLGESTYPGTPQPLVLQTEDRLRHLYLLGPTGVGKSTLIANLALQDIQAGFGVVVVDPKSDLIDDLLTRLPAERQADVVLLNPADTARPVGFNPLRAHGGEHQRELAAETTLYILRSIFRTSWGPRTDDLLRSALLSLTAVPAPDGSAFTLAEVPELLTNRRLRAYVIAHPGLDPRWRDYWQWYERLNDGERLAAIGPVMNKLRAFTHRTALRLVLGQSAGFDLTEIFTARRILLVPLGKGEIGPEAATLLGALLVGALWQATLARTSVPVDQRRPVFAYLDEFQDVVRLTDDIADMLAQARGLGLGLTLAHQYLGQLSATTLAAVLGTARTQLVFQVEHDDAKRLAPRFAPTLTAGDLAGLGPHEMAVRLSIAGQTRPPVTGRTFALPASQWDLAAMRANLATTHGRPRAEVEAALRTRTFQGGPAASFGEAPSHHQDTGEEETP
jgi:hypothetical protein